MFYTVAGLDSEATLARGVPTMSTPHIEAPDDAFASTVLMPGDPLRARHIAEN